MVKLDTLSKNNWHKNSKFKSIRSRYREYFGSLNFVKIGLDMGSTLNLSLTMGYTLVYSLGIKDLASRDGIFPLITNGDIDAAEVLKAYKNQP